MSCVPRLGVSVDVGRFVLNVFVPVNTFVPLVVTYEAADEAYVESA